MTEQKIWTSLELVNWTKDFLQRKSIDNPRLEAELLLAHAMDCKRIDLYVRFEETLAPEVLDRFRASVKERGTLKPLAYILQVKEFYGIEYFVDERVLIPRPETELLVDQAMECLGNMDLPDGEELQIADIGCGSGCIGLSMAMHVPMQVYLTDCSAEALAVATQNAKTLHLIDQVKLLEGDLFEPLRTLNIGPSLHAICSNPPYIGQGERDSLATDVLDHEPHVALFAKDDGLAILRRLLAEAGEFLLPGGVLVLEVGYQQREAVQTLAAEGCQLNLEGWHKDLQGHDRTVVFRKPA